MFNRYLKAFYGFMLFFFFFFFFGGGGVWVGFLLTTLLEVVVIGFIAFVSHQIYDMFHTYFEVVTNSLSHTTN